MRAPKSVLLTLAVAAVCLAQDLTVVKSPTLPRINCDEPSQGSFYCVDRVGGKNYEGEYVGHDEPSIIFYSNTPGSGNQSIYTLTLPKDPPTLPRQDGMGGTYNFQLHPAFWLGMALCDSQSAPQPNKAVPCVPNTDDNIYLSTNYASPRYIGRHPGAAFMELQFYPPGWINTPGISASNVYYAAINIDSYSFNMNTNTPNNVNCQQQVGDEPVNFAILTRNGVPLDYANPLGAPFGTVNPNLGNVLVMVPGDTLRVTITDLPTGLLTLVEDLTRGTAGFMIAGPANGFGQVDYNPSAKTCTVTPYAFHPMYATSSEDTRVPWAAHTYNVAFSDEIGHFEYCDDFNKDQNSPNFLNCTKAGRSEPQVVLDSDDAPCANPAFFGFPASFIQVTGCVGDDLDFDGPSYGNNWPGTGFPGQDATLHPTPIMFTSPRFFDGSGRLTNYDRVAFETDLPSFVQDCNVRTGDGCANLPGPGIFYPIYSTMPNPGFQCVWQLGGPNVQGVVNNFGGTVQSEYGPLVSSTYPTRFGTEFAFTNYRNVISNPCRNFGPQ